MNMEEFKEAYQQEMSKEDYTSINENFTHEPYRKGVVETMTKALIDDKSNHDYLKYNDAMRRASKRFKISKTSELKLILRKE